ncbi:MAG: tRNA (adenosine(37)-N6)-threonylcarbamoyltransferase complex transferase subunit TsaD [Candidatus Methylacidiphilales bacterium]|nr:tRNA (adenosine(37)-N6)-threonylcarbamoyltransferase complex transferase subunit TsaD [Candidatus Methylacidiphilales bacterium]
MIILGIETSCDETSVAIVHEDPPYSGSFAVHVNYISSQIAKHAPFGGVVPELATREHLMNLPRLVRDALQETELTPRDIDAIAVTEGPGLAASLLIGHSYARAFAVAADKQVIGVNHLEAHLFSPFLTHRRPVAFPFLGLIASGGHTLLVHVRGWDDYQRIGATTDDAAGECFDKVAKLLGLPYPGGPEVEKMARHGNPDRYDFPRSFPQAGNFNFSFSGLKTSVRYFAERNPEVLTDGNLLADVCASFQKAVLDVLVRKTVDAALRAGVPRVLAAGGVLCNGVLRTQLAETCRREGLELMLADAGICTDNAAMIAMTAGGKLAAGIHPRIRADIDPNLSLFARQPDREEADAFRSGGKMKHGQSRPGNENRAVYSRRVANSPS